jgi:hypothetical protein
MRTIKLAKPLTGHSGLIHEIVMREPTFAEYLEIGEPRTLFFTEAGTPMVVENNDNIRRYIELCVQKPADALVLEQGGLQLARQLKKAVLDFFQDPPTENGA